MNASNFKLSVNQDMIFFGVQNLGDLGKENLDLQMVTNFSRLLTFPGYHLSPSFKGGIL